MSDAFDKDIEDERSVVFQGLSEKDRVSVYSIGRIQKVNAGEVIIREGDTDQTVYIILDGSVKIVKNISGQPNVIATLPPGSCVGEISFARGYERTASAIALGPTKMMALTENGINSLSPNVKSILLRNLGELAARRIDDLTRIITELSGKHARLSAHFINTLKTRSDLSSQSAMVRQLLKSFQHLPMYTNRLSELLLQDRASADDITGFISSDPSLTAFVLKTANSPSYEHSRKVYDLKQASLFLGFNRIHQAVIDNGVWNVMPETPDFLKLQVDSILLSVIGFELGKLCGIKNPLIMSTLGMMHSIGRSIVLLLKKDYPALAPLFEMIDDAKIGAVLLKDWNLPDMICCSLELHHYPEYAGPEAIPAAYRETVSIFYLAHQCCEYLLGIKGHAIFLDEYMQLLGLSEKVPQLVVDRLVPVLMKKMNTFPESVRDLLAKSELIKKA